MTSFLDWRKTTWALVLWSGYIALWMVISGSDLALAGVWWLAGAVVYDRLRLITRRLSPPRGASEPDETIPSRLRGH
jgi:hypothetical protein